MRKNLEVERPRLEEAKLKETTALPKRGEPPSALRASSAEGGGRRRCARRWSFVRRRRWTPGRFGLGQFARAGANVHVGIAEEVGRSWEVHPGLQSPIEKVPRGGRSRGSIAGGCSRFRLRGGATGPDKWLKSEEEEAPGGYKRFFYERCLESPGPPSSTEVSRERTSRRRVQGEERLRRRASPAAAAVEPSCKRGRRIRRWKGPLRPQGRKEQVNEEKEKEQDGAHEPECKHIRQSTVYRKRHSRLESLFHAPARCWTSCAGDFTTKLRLHHEGSSFCIHIKHWRKGSGRSTAGKKQWHCPKISKIST